MFKCLNDLIATIQIQKHHFFALIMLCYLSAVAAYWQDIHVWVWVALICGLYFLAGDCKYKVDNISFLSLWWCGNVTLTLLLNPLAERPYMEGGGIVTLLGSEIPVLTIDYLIMAPFDLIMLGVICLMTYKNIQRLTIWSIIVCCYLVSNLWAHFNYSFSLFIGTDPSIVGAQYDSFMYASFYACLLALLIGSVVDRLLKYGHIDVNMDIDVLSVFGWRTSPSCRGK